MGGMKDEAKRITIPPLFPRFHVNETGKKGLSQPFDAKTMSLSKHSTLPSPTNLSLSLPPPPNNSHLIDGPEKNQFSLSPASKFEGNYINKKEMDYPNSRGPSVTNTKPSSIKQNEYHFKADTDLSLQFCTRNSIKAQGEAAGGLSESLEDASQNNTSHVMKTQLPRRNLVGFNNVTQKKSKILPPSEQDVSDCSPIDSLSGMRADKRFWMMRTYMINQQKIFQGQVFELHRLIMVQKMVAKSPKLVLQSKLNGGKPGTLSLSHPQEMAASKVLKPNTENHKTVTKEYPELMVPKLPLLPSISKELVNSVWPQQVPPLGNQWLIPVMSLSEGLVYKPYTGPSPPPPSAFMVPVYGQEPLNASFRFPVSTQFSHSYFPPTHTETTIDQTNHLQRWSSTSSHMTQAIPVSLKKSQESEDSEVHGSTASSPPKKHKFELLPLFPTEPTHQTDEYKQKQKQKPMLCAIKAIPHNPTSASESAARIFRSIQEERRDSDHMIS